MSQTTLGDKSNLYLNQGLLAKLDK